MADPKQLQQVLDLADKELEHAQLKLRAARSQSDALKEQLTQLDAYRFDYVKQASEKAGKRVAANHYQQYYHFIAKLDGAIDAQRKQIADADEAVKQFQAQYQLIQQKQKALSLLIEKELKRRQLRAEKVEQQQLDEFSLQQYLRRKA
ncbi:flagellar export protein FliJ [Ferrimonas aestuarii]|uniref:Flagellar FliJ protein n=1 Tax=Ferrimonas aestuarii TaxID=2569539 RepID=A0A4U1BWX9_9GAMM|nr:flagellar export protein FliJ [Ferrimonas aestuarii]TKB58235.1 flagellar export protein FliJ [Ferrimonas aestuarii]